MDLVNKIWYAKSPMSGWALISLVLLPFSFLFYLASAARRTMYRANLLKSTAPPVPVVVIGGITAGGSGKTPVCISLVRELRERGHKVGVLSRGYKARPPSLPYVVDESSTAEMCGDEPYLIHMQTGCKTVIDPVRRRGAQRLYDMGVGVIICDDGLQHYGLRRDVEILVIDSHRRYGNGLLLPAGPLREGMWRIREVDCIVENGASSSMHNYAMTLEPSSPYAIEDSKKRLNAGDCGGVCAMAGIANPPKFYDTLKSLGFTVQEVIHVSDHGTVPDETIKKHAQSMPVVMTQKDAVKYIGHGLENVWVLGVNGKLPTEFFDLVQERILTARDNARLKGTW